MREGERELRVRGSRERERARERERENEDGRDDGTKWWIFNELRNIG